MISFKPWTPKGGTLPVRYYVDGETNEYISKKNNKLEVTALTINRKRNIEEHLTKNGINLNAIGLTELWDELRLAGLLSTPNQQSSHRRYTKPHTQHNNVTQGNFGKRTSNATNFSFVNKTQDELSQEANRLNPSSAPFKDSTRKTLAIAVDHREPSDLIKGICSINLSTTVMSLDAGDVLVSDTKDSSRLLLIERKTITDLYNNITSEGKHAHHQAERYFDMMVAYAREGVSLQVIWIIEGEEGVNGTIRGLYNLLPEVKQVDGFINYLVAVCGQYVVSTFNTNHSCYMVAKLAQGWAEKSLYYPVKVGNVRVDKSRTERTAMTGEFKAPIKAEKEHHGVIRADDGLIGMLSIMPCINRKIATNLANTGRTFAEIATMSEEELLKVDGIGNKTAKNIRQIFNSKL